MSVIGTLSAGSLTGSGSGLTGVEASLLKDDSNATRASANTSGIEITGIATATTGSFGNLSLTANKINTTTGDLQLDAPTSQKVKITINDSTTVAEFKINGDGVPVLECAGDIVAFSGSDIDLKDNITPIENALDMISSLSGNTFSWKSDVNKLDTGIIAQEVEALGLPGITKRREDGTMGVRYDRLIPVLIEAIKELTKKVDSLENK